MTWRNSISFPAPLRNVTRCPVAGSREWGQRSREREQTAHERGVAVGAAAHAEEISRLRSEFDVLQQGVLSALRQAVSQVIRESENALIAIAIETARRLVAGLPVSAEMVESAVREALTQAEDSGAFVIELHPEDLALLQQVKSPLLDERSGGERLQLQASSEVTRGGCLVRTRFGCVDARRETKLEQIRKALSA